ncbi:hypothetical protein AM593_01677, partial [Mytilus galloprovincialis]
LYIGEPFICYCIQDKTGILHLDRRTKWRLRCRVPDSKNFDITLMITLLRDLTSVTPPAGGFDRLPKSTETTLGADLARIKFYRNRLAHLDDAKIDQVSFITNWNDVTSVCNVVLLSEN